jgi:hypothetical protein
MVRAYFGLMDDATQVAMAAVPESPTVSGHMFPDDAAVQLLETVARCRTLCRIADETVRNAQEALAAAQDRVKHAHAVRNALRETSQQRARLAAHLEQGSRTREGGARRELVAPPMISGTASCRH